MKKIVLLITILLSVALVGCSEQNKIEKYEKWCEENIYSKRFSLRIDQDTYRTFVDTWSSDNEGELYSESKRKEELAKTYNAIETLGDYKKDEIYKWQKTKKFIISSKVLSGDEQMNVLDVKNDIEKEFLKKFMKKKVAERRIFFDDSEGKTGAYLFGWEVLYLLKDGSKCAITWTRNGVILLGEDVGFVQYEIQFFE